MIEQGLLTEVEKLVNMGYDFNLPAISGIGYKQIGMLLKGELNLVDAAQKIKFETHRFARHQYAWFRLKDDRINWFDIPSRGDSEIAAVLDEFLKSKPVQPETTIHNV
jgi:tRNA dimethylallyltransferase